MVNLARMIKNQGQLDTVICPRVTGTGCLTRNKETPIIFLWKVTLKLTVPSSGASGSPLEIAGLPSPALWLKVWWVILGTSFPFLLLGHLVEHGTLFSFSATPLVLWPRGELAMVPKAGQWWFMNQAQEKVSMSPTTGSAIYLLVFKKKKKFKASNKSTGRSGRSSAIKLPWDAILNDFMVTLPTCNFKAQKRVSLHIPWGRLLGKISCFFQMATCSDCVSVWWLSSVVNGQAQDVHLGFWS